MAFPETPLPVVVEMYLGASMGWVDITNKVFVRDGGISISRGFPDEGARPEPSSMTMTLDNRDGRFTPRNPTGPYYGLIGRNTPVRVSVSNELAGDAHVGLFGDDPDDRPTALDAAALGITGDIDIRVDIALDEWTSAALAGKYRTDEQRSWAFVVDASGALSLGWSTDGTAGAVVSATSTVPAGLVNGERKALRVTLDVDNGSSGWTATFYTADTLTGSWVQLGSTVTDSGVTSIFVSEVLLEVGRVSAFTTNVSEGRLYGFELRDGIDGTVVANPDFGAESPETVAFTDAAGRFWQLSGSGAARFVNPGIRYVGEVSEWPPHWDVSESDVWTAVTAQGILRRLGQGRSPLRSPLRAALERYASALVGYWPLESAEATRIAAFGSALSGGSPMTYSGTMPDVGDLGIGPLLGSDKIPVLAADTQLRGVCGSAPFGDGDIAASVILDVPTVTGWADNTPILRVEQSTSGSTVAAWELRYKTGGDLQLRALDSSGSQLDASATLSFGIDDSQLWLHFYVTQSGSNTGWRVDTSTVNDDGAVSDLAAAGTFTGLITTQATAVAVAPTGGLAELAVGHVAVVNFSIGFGAAFATGDIDSAIVAHASERAATRADRLAEERGVALRLIGAAVPDTTTTAEMGPQAIPTAFIDAFTETHEADRALAYESRDRLGLSWRALVGLYNQDVALTLDYEGAGEIAPDLEPIDDDQHVRNDIEVKRTNGSSARAADSTSRLGTQDPPAGVGSYEHSVTLNLRDDAVLARVAGWLLHVGTWDEPRVRALSINLTALASAGKNDLIEDVCALEVGDRIQLTNLPVFAGFPDGTADLMVLGFQPETIGYPVEWWMTLNCVPYGPWLVRQIADDPPDLDPFVGRVDADQAAALRTAIDADDTSLPFDPNFWRWTTDADHVDDTEYPPMRIQVGGERMTVTAVATTAATFVAAGAASHADNAAVTPAIYAGAAADDWICVVGRIRGTAGSLATPSGYTLLKQVGKLYLWAKVHDGSESDPTLTPSGGSAGDTVTGITFGLRNMPITLDDLADGVLRSNAVSNGSAQDIFVPALAGGIYAGRVGLMIAGKSDDWTSVAVPSGWTEIAEPSTTTGSDQGIYLAYQIQTAPAYLRSTTLAVTGGTSVVSEAMIVGLAGGYQTLTVERSENGIEKSHAAGSLIALEEPIVLAL